MKKIMSVVLALAMIACLAAVFTFSAEEGFALSSNVSKVDDKTIEVTSSIQMPAARNMMGFKIEMIYDTDVLEPVQPDDYYDLFNLATGTKFDRWSPLFAIHPNTPDGQLTDRVWFTASDNSGRNTWNTDDLTQVITMKFTIKDGAIITSEDVLKIAVVDCSNLEGNVSVDLFAAEDMVTTFDSGVVVTPTLQSIEVTPPTKTEYYVGDQFDATGMVVTAKYDIGGDKDVTADAEVTGFDSATEGTKTITVSYGGMEKTFDVTVFADTLASIEVTAPTKTEYYVNDTFDAAGFAVKAIYGSGREVDVTAEAAYDAPDMTTVGEKTVIVTYNGKEGQFVINVKEDSLVDVVVTPSEKTTYVLGDDFSYKGLKVEATYESSKTEDVTEKSTPVVPDMASIGKKTVSVTYNDIEKTFDIIISTKGDVNYDGRVSLADVVLVAKAVLNDDADPNSPAVVFGDVNAEVGLSLADVTTLAKTVMDA